jgi:hypothetical protein
MKKLLISLILFLPYGLRATEIIYPTNLDDPTGVATINRNLQRLWHGKLDLKPGSIIPMADSTFDLGASGIEWANIYVDTVNTSLLNVTRTDGTVMGNFETTGTDANAWISLQNDAREFLVGVRGDTNDNFTILDNTASQNRFVIDSNGDIGIGTDTPENSLHIQRTDGTVMAQFNTSGANANAWMEIENDAQSFLLGIRGDTSDNFTLYDNTLSRDTLIVSTNGNVHVKPVGTADVALEVSNFSSTGGGTIHRAGSSTHSSKKIKSDIVYKSTTQYKTGYDDVKALKPARFRFHEWYKDENDKWKHRVSTTTPLRNGLIYEDAPESIKAENETISLDNRVLNTEMALIHLIGKLEDLQLKVDDLDAAVNDLDNRIDDIGIDIEDLTTRVEALEEYH